MVLVRAIPLGFIAHTLLCPPCAPRRAPHPPPIIAGAHNLPQIHIKNSEENQFLFETNTKESVDALVRKLVRSPQLLPFAALVAHAQTSHVRLGFHTLAQQITMRRSTFGTRG